MDLAERLIATGVKFSHIVSIHPDHKAVAQIAGYSDYTSFSERHGIPIHYARDYGLGHEDDLDFFREQRFDLLVQGGWQRLFPTTMLNTLKIGAIGVHGSSDFLPKGRGRSPMNWSILEGRERFILSLFLMEPGADDGPVFDFEMYDINAYDTIRTLYYKLVLATERMILRNLDALLEGRVSPVEQTGEPTYYTKRTPKDGRIDWELLDVQDVHRAVRAQTRPYPGAFAQIDGRWVRIWTAQIFDTRLVFPGKPYGAIVARFGTDLVINCRGGLLLVTETEDIAGIEFSTLGIEA
ncbi:MAG: hypothetical protein KF761_05775 [Salinibacterium sp.]|nr:hypothetical protein [Salinibacterium sp.]